MSSVLTSPFALLWMVASAVFPMLAFLIARTPRQETSRRPEIT
jgi:hypothetical protein